MTISKLYSHFQFAIEKNNGVECEAYPELFFPEDYPLPLSAQMAQEAIAICKRCPLLKQCHDYAMKAKEPYGVWGGTLPSDRL